MPAGEICPLTLREMKVVNTAVKYWQDHHSTETDGTATYFKNIQTTSDRLLLLSVGKENWHLK